MAVTHDWLDNMLPPNLTEKDNIYEIRFKATRKGFYRNSNNLDLTTGDMVVVDCDRGYDIGRVSMGGELVRLQMKKKRVDARHINPILRVAGPREMARLEELRTHEMEYVQKTRAIVYALGLNMKVSDIEFQADGSKAIFYYTAEQRIDFRELIKRIANEFRVRVEMRQIGVRQEAGRIGGVGSCGRELCCSSFLTEFKTVNTGAARYQNLSINPLKITGLCGRLKCCLNYELETYMDALKSIPDVREIHTELGVATLQKTDIFQRKMWFSYEGESAWVLLSADQVVELKRLNKQGIIPPNLMNAETAVAQRPARSGEDSLHDFVDVVGQSNLHERQSKKSRSNRRPRSGDDVRPVGPRPADGSRPRRGPDERGAASPGRNQSGRPAGPRPDTPRSETPRAENQRADNPRSESARPTEGGALPKRKKRGSGKGGGPRSGPKPPSTDSN